MKTTIARGKYVVSFNTEFDNEEVGESSMNTIDYAGDDIDLLAQEVIAGDPSFPMTFILGNEGDKIVGRFVGVGDDWPTALMVPSVYM